MAPPAGGAAGDAELAGALAESQRLGMLGDRPIADVIEHAGAFVLALAEVTGSVVDLGSGGGVPGLVIARARPDLRVVLVDRRATRTDHLRRLVARLALADRVEVLTVDATTLAARRAGRADAVVARSFAAPASTLRAAAPLVRSGGLIVVSEPPRPEPERWPHELVGGLGLVETPQSDRRVAVFRRAGAGQGPVPPKP
jgi:16S rRNA (guanine527-N7)-methyltransferase